MTLEEIMAAVADSRFTAQGDRTYYSQPLPGAGRDAEFYTTLYTCSPIPRLHVVVMERRGPLERYMELEVTPGTTVAQAAGWIEATVAALRTAAETDCLHTWGTPAE